LQKFLCLHCDNSFYMSLYMIAAAGRRLAIGG